ncbi:sensor histidine kinase [Chryseobacterium indologenes]|uniref:Signal transduction histidine kinase internal region domain-containing protein n=1 Tax=Chryseobacterium indologenes TaxID=253 RepID=A0A0N0IXV2_CHRID|nr:sensor histidine kinase [Chryseobacterium indologenes]KPE52583.1 hypothetical protein AOB46_00745 [Chryseobacterium indologenes]
MKIITRNQNTVTTLVGITLLAVLLFLMIPHSYGIALPFVYWVNQFLFFILMLGLTYFNTKWLAPKLLFQRKYFQYYLTLLLSCVLVIIVVSKLDELLNVSEEIRRTAGLHNAPQKEGHGKLSVYFYIFLIEILVLGVNIIGILIKKWQDEKNKRLQVEKDKIEMELSFLKSQINPHFFFNSLNTVNALTYTDVALSRNALKKLGKIMRHVLYNTSNESSTIASEIEFITNYLELMKMRSAQKVSIDFSVNIVSPDQKIASMLFLPFIENAFKYGVSTQAHSPITIKITEKNQSLVFYTKNKVFERTVNDKLDDDQNHGIGIQNTERRLELIYPGRYSLAINKVDGFEVQLKIDLDEN